MTAVFNAFQTNVVARRGVSVPLHELDADTAATHVAWGNANAAQLLKQHKAVMPGDEYSKAGYDAMAWWTATPLCQALTSIVDGELPPPPVGDPHSTDLKPEPDNLTESGSATTPHPPVDTLKLSVVERRKPPSTTDNPPPQPIETHPDSRNGNNQPAVNDRRAAAVAERHANEATNRANQLAAELNTAHNRVTELETAADQTVITAQQRSDRRLNRIVNYGTAIVIISVAVLVYVGGVHSAYYYARWNIWLAVLMPLSVEAGAAVELATVVRDRRHGITTHWVTKLLAAGLLGLSITAMLLHATDAPYGAFRWWGFVLAVALPLELAALIRSALGTSQQVQRRPGVR